MIEILIWLACIGVGVLIKIFWDDYVAEKQHREEAKRTDLERRFARVEGRIDKLEGRAS